ncbi:hypothetical protein [Neobacillus soli]|uniref:hypothetical protein n=1 Tax=Neobacillus soli TaxID=220688 RepID=UPI001C58168A|nr:hypothetical protein [Neobacillus soli]
MIRTASQSNNPYYLGFEVKLQHVVQTAHVRHCRTSWLMGVYSVLLKFAFQDFIEDRKFKNTTNVNIQTHRVLLGDSLNIAS